MYRYSFFLGHPIYDGPPTGHNGPEQGTNSVYVGKPWNLEATTLVRYTFLWGGFPSSHNIAKLPKTPYSHLTPQTSHTPFNWHHLWLATF